MGAIVGKASAEQAKGFYEFGVSLGMTFQLQDDILDVFGDEDKFGKEVGGDIVANKKTMLFLTALARSTPEQQEQLEQWYSGTDHNSEDKVASIKELFEVLEVRDAVERKMEEYHERGKEAIAGLDLADEQINSLVSLSDSLLQRDS